MTDNFPYKEHRLIFQQQGPSAGPKLGATIERAAANLLTAAADLLGYTTDIVKDVGGLVGVGVKYGKEGIRTAAEWAKDKYYGEPNNNLPEYDRLSSTLSYSASAGIILKTGDSAGDLALALQQRLAFMNFIVSEYTKFYEPLLREFARVEMRRNEAERRRRLNKPLIERFTMEIAGLDRTIKSDNLLPDDPRRIDMQTRLRALRSEKRKLEAESAEIVQWDAPEYQTVEFPPGTGRQIDRFHLDTKKGVTLNLDTYYEWLRRQSAFVGGRLEIYQKEARSLAYHRDKTLDRIASGPGGKTIIAAFNQHKVTIDQDARNAINGIRFTSTGSREVPGLSEFTGNVDYFAPRAVTNPGAVDNALNALP